jgi:hypothetical protein
MKARITSSRHGLYKLGYTFATMKILKIRYFLVSLNKCFLSTNRLLQFESVKTESPVIANQPSCGEQVLEFCTNRPSRSGRRFALSALKRSVCYSAGRLRPASVGF